MKNIKFKLKGSPSVYTFNGTIENFNSAYPNSEIVEILDGKVWDERLKKYV